MLIDEIFEIMNKSILSNFDILKMTKFLGIKFNGVLMNDQLKPEYFKQTFFIILNFDNVGQSGIHWVALYNDINLKTCYYMDSFGELPNQLVYDKIINSGHKLYFNKIQFQAIESQMCGWFSMYFLYHMQQKKKDKTSLMSSYLKLFSTKDYHSNDKRIKDLFKNLVKNKIKY